MMQSIAFFVVINLALTTSGLFGQELPTDQLVQKVSEGVNIPGLNASAIPIEEAKSAFKRKCETNGGPDAYLNMENGGKELEACIRGLVNATVLQDEIEAAKPTGDVDTVFRKYCRKTPILKQCVQDFMNKAELCFSEKERSNIRITQNITDSLLNFVCFKEGDRIALFIGAGGPECFSSKQSAIQDCLNSTFSSYIPAEGLTPSSANGLDNLPLLLLDSKECSDIERLQSCVVTTLETCHDPTAGNIVDSLFNFIKKVTPCENLLSKVRADASVRAADNGSATSSFNGAYSVLLASFAFFIHNKINH